MHLSYFIYISYITDHINEKTPLIEHACDLIQYVMRELSFIIYTIYTNIHRKWVRFSKPRKSKLKLLIYSFLIASKRYSILTPHVQNISHIQRYRSLCWPNCESFFIAFIDSIHLQTLSISAGNKLKYKILAEYLLWNWIIIIPNITKCNILAKS